MQLSFYINYATRGFRSTTICILYIMYTTCPYLCTHIHLEHAHALYMTVYLAQLMPMIATCTSTHTCIHTYRQIDLTHRQIDRQIKKIDKQIHRYIGTSIHT